MQIIADENIPFVREAFGALGEVTTLSGRQIAPEHLGDAEILLVRSVTKVDASLLEGSQVRFVATATIGTDHIDEAYLSEKGITFTSAPGCNANSVAEYIVAALLAVADEREYDLSEKRLGIVGVGHVGSRVRELATVLGMECVLNDPPLAEETGDECYSPVEAIFDCDIVTCHVPLTKDGPHPTHHLVDEAFIKKMRRGTLLMNTCRGSVIDEVALQAALESGHLGACVLDVWEHEPDISTAVLANTAIATPHIAGYSMDGKVNGTKQIYDAACLFLALEPTWDAADLMPPPPREEIHVTGDGQGVLRDAVLAAYNIYGDDKSTRGLAKLAADQRGPYFTRLRKEYPVRREFRHIQVIDDGASSAVRSTLTALGFHVTKG